ncbi:glycosyltransferase family 2 protein [Pseudobacteroides cellulosolvens]|uniref:Glycosyl transferase family 2 n=1 Tax=Pseudobacteroides cellulosolvens ATCC 35603 = DSM 2933 TaxID=398512 RepID=A0A0L6JM31_9FIRM|nr:glycosyltransferase family 2 protein [Pseudobacteroides cellulosolvens]KNY26829.1 glycosyl transferase family 2 [Pseudobacteroides cellulosolvens ATCC 35603 = DSM 2933]
MDVGMVSVIVPVYNVEKYIENCINSLIKQTYKNIEIILVDDGSTDKSGSICDNFCAIDNRIKVIHTQNKGVSAARNKGIEVSTGCFIQFVDSDDTIDENMTKRLVQLMGKNIDLVICGYRIKQIRGKNRFLSKEIQPIFWGQFTKDDFVNNFGKFLNNLIVNSPVNKLYSASLIKGYRLSFPENISIGEDLIFNLEVINKSSRIYITKEVYYNYINHNQSSLMLNYKKDFFSIQQILFSKLYQFLHENDKMSMENEVNIRFYYIRSIFCCLNNLFHNNSKLSFRNKVIQIKEIITDNQVQNSLRFKPKLGIQYKIIITLIYLKQYLSIYLFFTFKSHVKKLVERLT